MKIKVSCATLELGVISHLQKKCATLVLQTIYSTFFILVKFRKLKCDLYIYIVF